MYYEMSVSFRKKRRIKIIIDIQLIKFEKYITYDNILVYQMKEAENVDRINVQKGMAIK